MSVKLTFLATLFISFSLLLLNNIHINKTIDYVIDKKPNDWFYLQRSYPYEEINYTAYKNALDQTDELKNKLSGKLNFTSWQFAGPANIGGRITDIEINPGAAPIIYAGAATGGVLKSVDGGINWYPIFDEQLSLSIGDIGLARSNPSVIYVGTGEANCGGGSLAYEGMGVFKSTDAGENWIHVGLEKTRNIGRIVIDPTDPDRVYVAAMGKLFAGNPERGLYRTTDGGSNWENVLFISDTTGCIDVVVNPSSPDTIYAAMWERIRYPWGRSYGGITSGIHRSYDGGDTWEELTNGLPVNTGNIGRIGLALCESNPQIIYAIYADDIGYFAGVYKTTDGGNTWTRSNDGTLSNIFISYGWWFGNIRVAPDNPDVVYAMGLDIYKSTDGGNNWLYSSGLMHVDQHGLDIHPANSDFMVAGNDGGIYTSQNGGSIWTKVNNLPITQFYTCEIDNQQPYRLYGGAQDNGTNRTLTGSFDDWHPIFGGDGFYVLVDPTDNQYVYAESQYGGFARSTNGGSSFSYATNGIEGDRRNWNTPVVFDPSNPQILYYGSNKLNRTINRAESWNVISPDLTNGPGINIPFGTITTIAVAKTDSNYIYVGTDDGNVWVTIDGGTNWNLISSALPQRWVTRIAVDPFNESIAYVTYSGYRWDEYLSHIFRTTNAGSTWADISSNLPEAPLTDIILDSDKDSTIYISSDVGVFVTYNLGSNWSVLGDSLPNVPIMDLTIHNDTRTLVAATYGRSMYKINVNAANSVDKYQTQLPAGIVLEQNFPNPFNPVTKIRFTIPTVVDTRNYKITLAIYDVLGNKITTLLNEEKSPGYYEVEFDGGNLASGVYIYRLISGSFISSKKLLLLK